MISKIIYTVCVALPFLFVILDQYSSKYSPNERAEHMRDVFIGTCVLVAPIIICTAFLSWLWS